MRTAAQFRDIVVKNANGNFVRLADVANISDATRNSRSVAWFNKQPAVLLTDHQAAATPTSSRPSIG